MNLLKILGLTKGAQPKPQNGDKAAQDRKNQERSEKSGGCCGSCGGQGHH